MGFRRGFEAAMVVVALLSLTAAAAVSEGEHKQRRRGNKDAYAAMMYMGTPRDYEFYVATRVMMRSLIKLDVKADLVVIASIDVPLRWVRAMYVFYCCLLYTSPSPRD